MTYLTKEDNTKVALVPIGYAGIFLGIFLFIKYLKNKFIMYRFIFLFKKYFKKKI